MRIHLISKYGLAERSVRRIPVLQLVVKRHTYFNKIVNVVMILGIN